MLKKAHSILALAASATIGAGLLIGADDRTPADTSRQDAAAVQDRDTGTMQGNRAVMDQLREIAKDPNSASDKLFLLNTDIDNTAEIRLNQTISSQDDNPLIKQLADHMIKDHQAMIPKLEGVATDVGMQLPHEVPAISSEEARIITSMSGKQMENAYLTHMWVAHSKLIAAFESASTTSTNPKVRQFATDALPTLQQHRDMVEQTAGTMGIVLSPNEALPASARIRNGTERPGSVPGKDVPVGKQ
jgi:putative membrane protein